MKNALFASAFVALLSACDEPAVEGNGRLVERTPRPGAFTGVSVGLDLEGFVSPGPGSVRVNLDENLHDWLEPSTDGGTLEFRARDGRELDASEGAWVRMTSPRIERVSTSGAAKLVADVSPTERLPLRASGASILNVRSIASRRVDVRLSGASVVTLAGSAEALSVDASGASDVDSRVPCEAVEVEASGASRVRVLAARSIRGRASGASEITVVGRPAERAIETSGAATVVYVDD